MEIIEPALLAMVSLLLKNQYTLVASPDDLYNFIINILTVALSFNEIVAWLRTKTEHSGK